MRPMETVTYRPAAWLIYDHPFELVTPLLAKDRKVIVAEMQRHGRTRDVARQFSYEAMADDVSGLLRRLK